MMFYNTITTRHLIGQVDREYETITGFLSCKQLDDCVITVDLVENPMVAYRVMSKETAISAMYDIMGIGEFSEAYDFIISPDVDIHNLIIIKHEEILQEV